ncbi:MAG: glycyl-radical enzyme activating protein [Phycisphaerae bacterium]|nr:glycyl-radical enzyme activating protein [Phycisphaerae bacterium]
MISDSDKTKLTAADNSVKKGNHELKGLIFDIKKYAIHDGPGIRTTVFFKGCPLHCQWCHNPESWRHSREIGLRSQRCIGCGDCIEACGHGAISMKNSYPVTDMQNCVLCGDCQAACRTGAREVIGREMTVDEVMAEIEKDRIFFDQSNGGATFSGGEVLMQHEFLDALLVACKKNEIKTAVDTTCHTDEAIIQRISENADLFLCDLKHMDSNVHKRFTGIGNERILANIKHLALAGNEIIIRIPITPGFNDDDINIDASGRYIASLDVVRRIDILPYNSGGREKSDRLTGNYDIMHSEPPTDESMRAIRGKLKKFGFEVKIDG